jgi:hypothetical protein
MLARQISGCFDMQFVSVESQERAHIPVGAVRQDRPALRFQKARGYERSQRVKISLFVRED